MKTPRLFSTLVVMAALLLSFISSPATAGSINTGDPSPRILGSYINPDKIDPTVLDALLSSNVVVADGIGSSAKTDFLVWLTERADLSRASFLATKADKGKYVYSELRSTAERSQVSLRDFLGQQGAAYQAFYIVNAILVRNGNLTLALSLAARSDVARITGNSILQLPPSPDRSFSPQSPADIEPNLTFINADNAWALGVTGQGTVLASIDTGLQWDHPAIIDHYRGWDGDAADHNYNWWDATGQYPSIPADGNGHGTMVTGVMLGGEGADNQIGVAPGAKTIHCKALNDGGGGYEADFYECFEWILAPWDLSGANPRPDLAPDALTNSWGFYGGYYGFETIIDILQMAGILVEASVGGEGPGCATLVSPADYAQVLSTGGVDQNGGVLPGTLSPFSARGPSLHDPGAYIPEVMAPSVEIRSSYPNDTYQVWSGTSLAGPHVTGLVGLMWSANPLLRGNIYDTYQILYDTAVPLTGQMGSNCGGDYITGPNNDWGYGTIDALAAVQQALGYGNAGRLQGAVTDIYSHVPLAQTEIQAYGIQQWITATNSLGLYSLVVPSGTYTVSTQLAGYYTEVITAVTVISGEVSTQNFTLLSLPATISGTVTDANTGGPLVAEVQVSGGLITSTVTDPVTGIYNLTLAANRLYTLTAQAPGYGAVSTATEELSGNIKLDFTLPAGWLGVDPPALDLYLISGKSLTTPITLTNTGGLSLTFELSTTVGWLMALPVTGTLPASSMFELSVQFESAGLLAPGVYTTTLLVETSTPYSPVSLPVRLTVIALHKVYLPCAIYPPGR